MKVRKPTSKRVPVRLRHKIEKASAAKQRKERRNARKNPNPQWKSRVKKDPGIPNSFPFKEQLLAEVEEKKRIKEEERMRKREMNRQKRKEDVQPATAVGDGEEEVEQDVQVEEDMEVDDKADPMAALLESARVRAKQQPQPMVGVEEEDEWDGFSSSPEPEINEKTVLPKEAIADPFGVVQKTIKSLPEEGIQAVLSHYKIPPLVTAGSDLETRFLVEVARKCGRLGKGGVPNLHSAALAVLSDIHEGRLVLPRTESKTGKGEVKVVSELKEPFRLEGLW
ncbi:hypothetical protein K470DRAFT_255740 [Piedraia hortae CBS 480.64]|uniref:Guanine nucleotide-binding protein-like 3 N-terminal domain-containing protein n=1 Tax=Piedraia hortae CBS 480.64 TaxID=1314780 RepID=A0A6A7C6H8_9PEZI|nr:hypothetical protein K470DRAFT_255740 [Piedraia hortae CBS 480.64]